jgi:hypothetical protein
MTQQLKIYILEALKQSFNSYITIIWLIDVVDRHDETFKVPRLHSLAESPCLDLSRFIYVSRFFYVSSVFVCLGCDLYPNVLQISTETISSQEYSKTFLFWKLGVRSSALTDTRAVDNMNIQAWWSCCTRYRSWWLDALLCCTELCVFPL